MPSIFNAEDLQTMIARINRLTPNSPALWGKMNASQMLAHLQEPMKAMTGEVKLKHSFIGILFGGIAKRQMLSGKPFKKNLPTDPSFLMKDPKDFETEKAKVTALLHDIQQAGSAGVTKEPHSFFGKMPPQEWDSLTWKHVDHHLQQFGV
jgi:hypothetical protein